MTLKQADHITQDFAKFLEISHGNLLLLFKTDIPEGLLPYKKEVVENAFNIMLDYYSENEDATNAFKAAMAHLLFYTNSTKGIKVFISRVIDEEFSKQFPKSSSEQQDRLLDYAKKNFQ